MRFSIASAFAALATLAAADSIEFCNQDSTTRTIVFTANLGLPEIASVTIAGLTNQTVPVPIGWIGNFYSVSEGAPFTPGMLGEVTFGGFVGDTFFDVSAIVNPDDVNGVKELFPKVSQTPMSGCPTFPCPNAYYQPDDNKQSLSTPESDLVCLLGTPPAAKVRRHPRHFVAGRHA